MSDVMLPVATNSHKQTLTQMASREIFAFAKTVLKPLKSKSKNLSIKTKRRKNKVKEEKQKNAKSTSKSGKTTSKMQNNEKFYYDDVTDKMIVNDILSDFKNRARERKQYELMWELNMNFMLGNQYSIIGAKDQIETSAKNYYWEEREVYNHIAPIIETRLAKLGKVRPTVSVRPTGNEQSDLFCAKLSKAILSATTDKINLSDLITQATIWSEVTGTSFYKVVWDNSLGDTVASENGKPLKNGDISITVCPPFEIYPDSSGSVDIEACESLIHARAYPVEKIRDLYHVETKGEDIDTFTFENFISHGSVTGFSNIPKLAHSLKHNHALVIEKYEKPTKENVNGRLTIVAGDKLVYDGEIPFEISNDKTRSYPFIRQISTSQVGSFWGTSVVERCIPIQRAYNAIKNRKHEYLARLACGVLAVEDGSVDIDNIEEEGLAPGKILVYRNGSSIPKFIDAGSIPNDFDSEEDRLLNEFITVSGVSEFMRDSTVPTTVSSGTALSLLIEQDETRLSVTAEYIRSAVKKIAQFIIRLYKQFAVSTRLSRIADGNGEIEIFYWKGSQLTNDDIVLDTINELTETPAQRKSMLLDLYKNGLLFDENGKLSNRNRAKLLESLGFGVWESEQDISSLHIKKAVKENIELEDVNPREIDDHDIHITEHTKYLLSCESDKATKEHIKKIEAHILAHKSMKLALSQLEIENSQKYKIQ